MANKLLHVMLLLISLALFSCNNDSKGGDSSVLSFDQLYELRTHIQTKLEESPVGITDGTYPQENYDALYSALQDLNLGISKANAGLFILQFEVNNYILAAQKAIKMFEDSKIMTIPAGTMAELFVNGVDHKGYIDFGASPDYCGGPQFTVETWTKYDQGFIEFVFGSFISVFTSPAPFKGWTLHYWGVDNSLLRFSVGEGDNLPTVAAATPQTYGEWIHMAASFDKSAGKLNIFINGVLKSSADYSGNIDLSGDKRMWAFVEPLDHSRCMSGYIKKFRMWNVAKSESEIKQLMSTDVTGTESDLLCAWDFTVKPEDDSNIPSKKGTYKAAIKGVYKWKAINN